LRELGKLDEAEAALREAVAIDRKVYLKPSLYASENLNELAVTLWDEDKVVESDTLLQQQLAILQQLLPADHPDIATTYNNMARGRALQGNYAGAEELQRKSLSMDLRLRGETHPFISQSRIALARYLIPQGKLQEAQDLTQSALAADRARHADAHPSVAADLAAMAELARARGDTQKALDLSEQALAMFEHTIPPNHPKHIDALLAVAENLLALDRLSDATARYAQALAVAQAATPPVPRSLARIQLGQSRVYVAQGESAKARASLQAAAAALAGTDASHDMLRADIERQLAELPASAH